MPLLYTRVSAFFSGHIGNMGVQQLGTVNAVDCLAEICEISRQRQRFSVSVVEEGPICPKPRRGLIGIGLCSHTDTSKPLLRLHSHFPSLAEGEAAYELMEIILNKGSNTGVGGDERISNQSSSSSSSSSSSTSSSPYYNGSPPRRAGNPLIHDVYFTTQPRNNFPPPFLLHTSLFEVSSNSNSPPFSSSSSFSSPATTATTMTTATATATSTTPLVRIEGFDNPVSIRGYSLSLSSSSSSSSPPLPLSNLTRSFRH